MMIIRQQQWRHRVLTVGAFLALATATAPTAARAGGDDRAQDAYSGDNTQAMQDAIRDEMRGAGVSIGDVRVHVDRGRVTLDGTVPSYAEKVAAEEAVTKMRGIVEVRNRLDVDFGDAGDRDGGARQTHDDKRVERDVITALKNDPATDEYQVMVNVKNGVVRLSGAVDSFQEKALAQRIAGRVAGVRDVDNVLQVRPPVERDDRELTSDVKQRLRFDAKLDDAAIRVSADAGRVVLSGTVDSLFDRAAAIGHAYAAGARNVDAAGLRVAELDRAAGEIDRAAGELDRAADKTRQTFSGLSDAAIGRAIGAALKVDPRVKDYDIDVKVKGGVATLTGTVDNLPAKRAAIEDAQQIAGIRQISDRIAVVGAGAAGKSAAVSDKVLQGRVDKAVSAARGIEPGEVTVNVDDGRVTLRGRVDSFDERTRAVDAASNVAGVVAVNDRLNIERAMGNGGGGGDQSDKSDAELAEDIRAQLFWSPYVDAGDVEVTVEDGVAKLTGDVDSWFEKQQAAENALQAGAYRVDNRLRVSATSGARQ